MFIAHSYDVYPISWNIYKIFQIANHQPIIYIESLQSYNFNWTHHLNVLTSTSNPKTGGNASYESVANRGTFLVEVFVWKNF